MDFALVGLSHRTAPIEVRERLAALPGELPGLLGELATLPSVAEVVLLSTCNRVEAYAASADPAAAIAALRGHLARRAGLPGAGALGAAQPPFHVASGAAAVRHLFRVAASLDSMVVGEPQVLGQVKEAYEVAARAGTVGRVLGFVFPRAFRAARRVRRETDIARHPVSVSAVAVELAGQVWSGFSGRRVLLVGAGKMAHLAARALAEAGAQVAVTNRSAERARSLAAELGFAAEPWDDLPRAIEQADIVLTSTGSRQPILGPALLDRVQRARRHRPLVLVDIAVPRDVDPAVDGIEGIYRWDIDDLQKVAAEHLGGRRQEADRAEIMVESEVARALAARRTGAVAPVIAALRARVFGIATAEATKALAGLPHLDERARRAVLALADAISAKLLHAPQIALKRSVAEEDDRDVGLAAAAARLFELPEPPATAPGEAAGGADAGDGGEQDGRIADDIGDTDDGGARHLAARTVTSGKAERG